MQEYIFEIDAFRHLEFLQVLNSVSYTLPLKETLTTKKNIILRNVYITKQIMSKY